MLCGLTCWGSRPPSWRRDPRGSSCSWRSRSALRNTQEPTPRASANQPAPTKRNGVQENRRSERRLLTRGKDLGAVGGAGAADGEAAALELRADLLLHRGCGRAGSVDGGAVGERRRVGRSGGDLGIGGGDGGGSGVGLGWIWGLGRKWREHGRPNGGKDFTVDPIPG